MLLQFGRVMTSDWVHDVGHSPVCQILLQIVVSASIMASPPASTGKISAPADFPFFCDSTAASTFSQRMGSLSVLDDGGTFSISRSPVVLWLYNPEQYSVHLFSLSRSSVRQFPSLSWMVVALPCFVLVRSFTSWYACLLLFYIWLSSIS